MKGATISKVLIERSPPSVTVVVFHVYTFNEKRKVLKAIVIDERFWIYSRGREWKSFSLLDSTTVIGLTSVRFRRPPFKRLFFLSFFLITLSSLRSGSARRAQGEFNREDRIKFSRWIIDLGFSFRKFLSTLMTLRKIPKVNHSIFEWN